MNSQWKIKFRTTLILLLTLLPGFLAVQTVYGKNLPFLTISLSATTAPLGGTVTVSATLGGATASAGGTVIYSLFSGGSCSGIIMTTMTRVVTAGVVPKAVFTMSSAGTFSFQAAYSGDANNYPATSLCSASVKVIGTPTLIKTTPSATTILVGTSLTDKISGASGTNIGTATGTVTFKLIAGPTCSGAIVQSQALTIFIPGNIFLTSNPFTVNNAGTYSLRAIYSGDSMNAGSTSSCEGPITVNKKTPTLSTTFSTSTVTVGQPVSDASAFTPGTVTPTAGGTVTYNLFGNGACAGPALAASTVTVTNGVVPNSPNFIITSVGSGSLSFTAVYSGDKNNKAATSMCEGPIIVNKATPSVFTNPSSFSISAGSSVTDTATLTGATFNAGGTVTYKLWNDGACGGGGGTVVQTFTVTVTSGSVPSVSFTISTPGSYSIRAVYNGDANNNGATSGCEATITVT